MTTASVPLRDDEAHVWYAWTDRCSTPELLACYRSLLNAEERGRLERFAFEHLKREYLVTRALCRLTLSRYADRDAGDWVFRTNRYGRPEIDGPERATLRFNLSNARSLVACVITRRADAGIDVEELDRRTDVTELADRFFSPAEVAGLRALPAVAQRRRFFELWTLKESYMKARGMGLAIPLEQFSFALGGDEIAVTFDPALEDDATDWQFAQYRLGEAHALAVGIRKERSPAFAISIRETVPLAAHRAE